MDHYATLELPRQATLQEIRSAYYRLSRDSHPDRHSAGTNEQQAQAAIRQQVLNRAYRTLSDVDKKRRYDVWLREQQSDINGDAGPENLDHRLNVPQAVEVIAAVLVEVAQRMNAADDHALKLVMLAGGVAGVAMCVNSTNTLVMATLVAALACTPAVGIVLSEKTPEELSLFWEAVEVIRS